MADLRQHHDFGPYAAALQDQQKFLFPRAGTHDDNAHPPIHPVKCAGENELQGDEKKLFNLVCRHFLACVSHDARGERSKAEALVAETEIFSTNGLMITERNWLEVYT